eukprot:jgi/Galph1/4062/GphlegSOOS_G2726.1
MTSPETIVAASKDSSLVNSAVPKLPSGHESGMPSAEAASSVSSTPRKSNSKKLFLQQVSEMANAAMAPIKSAFEFLTNTAVSGFICDDQLAREWQERNRGNPRATSHDSMETLQRRRSVPIQTKNISTGKESTQLVARRSTGGILAQSKHYTKLSQSEQEETLEETMKDADDDDDNISYYTCADSDLVGDSERTMRQSFATEDFQDALDSPLSSGNGTTETQENDLIQNINNSDNPSKEISVMHRYKASFSAAHDDYRRGSGDQAALAEAASLPGFEMASVASLRKQILSNREVKGDDTHSDTLSTLQETSTSLSTSVPVMADHSHEIRLASYPNDAEPVTPDGYRVKDEFLDETDPPQNMSFFRIIREVFKDVKKGGDLTSISVPASLLEPVSACEKVTRIMQRGELLQDIVHAQDALERFLQVTRFILSGLPKEKFSKKPYNPILGETFQCAFEHRNGGGRTVLISEQVSHHPPITAVHLRNDTLGVRMTSYTEPEAKFWGNSIEIKLKGRIRFYLTKFDEEYISNRTSLILNGILGIGRFHAEWRGPLHMYCEKTGYEARLEFKGTTLMGLWGEANAVEGKIVQKKSLRADEVSEHKLFSVEGSWDHQIRIKDSTTKEERVLFDYEGIAQRYRMKLLLPPPERLEETNSLYVWEPCTRAILERDSRRAAQEKHKIEEEQRRLRRERMKKDIVWEPKYFYKSLDGDGYIFREEAAEQLFYHKNVNYT